MVNSQGFCFVSHILLAPGDREVLQPGTPNSHRQKNQEKPAFCGQAIRRRDAQQRPCVESQCMFHILGQEAV